MKIFYSEFKTVDKKSKDIFIGDGLIVFAENAGSKWRRIYYSSYGIRKNCVLNKWRRK